MRRVLSLVLAIAIVFSSGITAAFAIGTGIYGDSGEADQYGIVSVEITSGDINLVVGERAPVDVTVRVKRDSGGIPYTLRSNNEAVATIDFDKFNDGFIVIAVGAGSTEIEAGSGDRRDTVTITVSPAPAPPSVRTTAGTFDKETSKRADVEITVDLGTAPLAATGITSVSNDTTALAAADYAFAGTTLTIKKEYLATLAVGTATMNIVFNDTAETTGVCTITVSDTTAPPAPVTKYDVTVTGGTANPTTATKGEKVTITAAAPASGKVFDKWTITDGVTFADATTTPTTFTMPEKAVTVVATYKDAPVTPPTKYAVTVTGGTANPTTATKGKKVTITAAAPATGKVFDKWTTTDGVTFANATKTSTTFTMLEKAVTVVATYKDAPVTPPTKYAVTVTGGTTDKATAAKNETVNITATAPATGKVFDKWTTTDGVTFADATKTPTTFAMLEKAVTVVATYKNVPSTGGGSSSGSSSGGGTSTPSVDAPPSNVGGSGEVKSEDIKAETSKAVADAVKAATGATATVTVENADNITPAALKEMAAAATKAGGKVQLSADTVVNGVVETRLYINPALAATLTAPIKLGVLVNSLEIDATKASFASFDNKIAVASFAQQGSFGMKIQVAVKLDLTGLNTKTLVFYSYDKATNTYVPIVAPAYTIDKNGYLHFSTTVGGDIIITDKALVKK